MISSLLIANRGEIACRIIRTAKRMGVRTIAVYSEADRGAPHMRMADEAYFIGAAPARESYLRGDVILEVAKQAGAEAVHPGYGFLSENTEFAEACAQVGIIFVGPSSAAIKAMGLKDAAKALVQKAGVPVVPGYHGTKQDADFLQGEADKIGYPVLIKAVAGGGGKGMRKVERAADFKEALASAAREGASSFGDPRVLIEKYITAPRHIEMQVFGDSHGNYLHLFERDCSAQRRHQKVLEEAPAPGMTQEMRAAMGKAAVDAARSVKYCGAGTVEFIVDGANGLRADGFYFMEMNTRLQVEHPVTEAITGLDLVEWQLRVASGESLPLRQDEIHINGHAVEARLYAEDPETGFLPSTGTLHHLRFPKAVHGVVSAGVRIDSGVEEGGAVSPFYDPMIAKIITHGKTRDEALDELVMALRGTYVAGPKTNLNFLVQLANHPEFRGEKGVFTKLDTGLIERHLEALHATPQPLDEALLLAGTRALLAEGLAAKVGASPDPWAAGDAFQMGAARSTLHMVMAEGALQKVNVPAVKGEADGAYRFVSTPECLYVLNHGRQVRLSLADPLAVERSEGAASGGLIRAPMHGKVIAVYVENGERVSKGQKLAVVEAMKMEHALTAPFAGIVRDLVVEAGAQVGEGAKIMLIEAEASEQAAA